MKKANSISAQVILKTNSGVKFNKPKAITSRNISTVKPDESAIKKVAALLKVAGFEVEPSQTTISITGNIDNFKRYFNVKNINAAIEKKTIAKTQELNVPEELKEYVTNVVLPYKPELF